MSNMIQIYGRDDSSDKKSEIFIEKSSVPSEMSPIKGTQKSSKRRAPKFVVLAILNYLTNTEITNRKLQLYNREIEELKREEQQLIAEIQRIKQQLIIPQTQDRQISETKQARES